MPCRRETQAPRGASHTAERKLVKAVVRTKGLLLGSCLLSALAAPAGCRPARLDPSRVARPDPAEARLERFAGELARSDPRELYLALSPVCRQSARGIAPVLIDQSSGYQVARWVRRREADPAPLLADLLVIFGSYARVDRCALEALRRRRFPRAAFFRAYLSCEGTDRAGFRRSDNGWVDVQLALGPTGRWRIEQFYPALVHTIRRVEPGYGSEGREAQQIGHAARGGGGERSAGTVSALMGEHGALTLLLGHGAEVWAQPLDRRGEASGARSLVARVRGARVRAMEVADLDGDGLSDVFVGLDRGASSVWLQRAARRFERAREWPPIAGAVTAVAAADLDRDGWLDLVLARCGAEDQRGDAAIRDDQERCRPHVAVFSPWGRTGARTVALDGPRAGALCVGDLNGDLWPDVVTMGEGGVPGLWINRRGALRREARGSGSAALPEATACALGDVDGDGRTDLVLGRATRARSDDPDPETGLRVLYARPTGWFERRGWRARPIPFPASPLGLVLLDHDNDGDTDLWARTPLGEHLVVNAGHGSWVDGSWVASLATRSARGRRSRPAAGGPVFELNGDGALDLLEGPKGRLTWQAGRGDWGEPGAAHAVLLRLEDLRAGRTANRDAVGARIRLFSGGRWQSREVGSGGSGLLSAPPGYVHFGVGSAVRVEELHVRWPDGGETKEVDLPVDRLIVLERGRDARWREFGP